MMVLRFLRPWLMVALAAALAGGVGLGLAWLVGDYLIARAEPGTSASPPGRLLTIDGHAVHVTEFGDGPPVLLLHGLAGSSEEWPPALRTPLAHSYRTITVDLYGMGFSARDEAFSYDTDLWTEQLAAVVVALDLGQVSLVGRDLGAIVAVTFAGRHPEQVRRLVLIAPRVPLSSGDEPTRMRALRVPGLGEAVIGWSLAALPGRRAHPAAAVEVTWQIPGTRHAVLAAVRTGVDPDTFRIAAHAVRAPTLVLHGRADTITPLAAVERWVPLIENVMVRPLDDVGHWPAQQTPDTVADATIDFLGGSP